MAVQLPDVSAGSAHGFGTPTEPLELQAADAKIRKRTYFMRSLYFTTTQQPSSQIPTLHGVVALQAAIPQAGALAGRAIIGDGTPQENGRWTDSPPGLTNLNLSSRDAAAAASLTTASGTQSFA